MWYSLGAKGSIGASRAAASSSRDSVATRMTPGQISLAQDMSRDCETSNFRKCGHLAIAKSDVGKPSSSPSKPAQATRKSSGTGFFVSLNGHVVTNHHVVDNCGTLHIVDTNGGMAAARLVRSSKVDDLALLQSNLKPVSVASFRDSARINQGETVIAYGYPLSGILASSGNVSSGLVTALSGIGDNPRQMQISAPVQPGNSGGPLSDATGAVIGVVVSKLNALVVARILDDIPQNINFAIKLSAVADLLGAAGIDYKIANASKELSITEITRQMKTYTVRIQCN